LRQNNSIMSSIIGHTKILSYFQSLHTNNNLGQSYLFSGPAHTGKQTVTKALIQSFLCTGGSSDSLFGDNLTENSLYCGSCQSCKMFDQQSHPDYLFITKPEDKQNLSVELIRSTISQAYRSPVMGDRKYLVIDQAERMSKGASNALLKTLEEPPESCAIFLLSHHPAKLPKTIASRCALIEFTAIDENEKPENDQLWQKAQQLPGNYQSFLNDEHELELVHEERELFIQFISLTPGKRLQMLETFFKSKKKTHTEQKALWSYRLQLWKVFLRDILMLKLQCKDLLYFQELAGLDFYQLSEQQIITAQDELSSIAQQLPTSVNLRLQLESFALHV